MFKNIIASLEQKPNNPTNLTLHYTTKCIEKVEKKFGFKLTKKGRSAYVSPDGLSGFVFSSSKAYKQDNRQKYWYGFRKNPFEAINGCEKKFMVYGCKNADKTLVVPLEKIESLTERMNYSIDEDGNVSHWHVNFYIDKDGYITQLLSHPEIEEIDMNQYLI